MNRKEAKRALGVAVKASREVGALMRRHLRGAKVVQVETQHDIKLELDVLSQKLIERRLLKAFPGIAILGEEGVAGDSSAPLRWVVDPIDGTVNFAYGIPHSCVSIALQARLELGERDAWLVEGGPAFDSSWVTVLGVVYEPFSDELWTGVRGEAARLNGRVLRVSQRKRLEESLVSLGFGKKEHVLNELKPAFLALLHRVRKLRIMGAAALALTYVGSGRLDAYVESGVRLWDIAAGGLIVECAGGEFHHELIKSPDTYSMTASNGLLRPVIERALASGEAKPRRTSGKKPSKPRARA